MKNFVFRSFAVLGVVFLVIILIGIYFFITDPYEIRPLLFGQTETLQNDTGVVSGAGNSTEADASSDTSTVEAVGGFELSAAQIDALVSLGIDPTAVPASVSAEQEACFVDVLGEIRVEEIKAGEVPSPLEFIRAGSCI